LETIIAGLAGDRDLAFMFFGFFSRFEYAVKRGGFLKGATKAVGPDWDAFANSLRGRFQNVKPPFGEAVAFLLKEPPRTQVVSGTGLGWVPTVQGNGESHERYILRLVTTIRNNLFHGGKYPVPIGPMDDVARNRRLLEAGLVVLKQCLELNKPVKDVFEETP
jgi:hypothetical protein